MTTATAADGAHGHLIIGKGVLAVQLPVAHDSTLPTGRLEKLIAEDAQIRDSFPLKEVVAAKLQPGLRLAQAVQTVMEGYAERPAVAERRRELVTDPATGRSTLQLRAAFDTITYRELWARSRAIAGEWSRNDRHPLKAGDFVCMVGFASADYVALSLASIHLGAVNVPLQTSAPAAQHAEIIAETEPRVLAAGINYLDTAVDAVLSGAVPKRLVVFDYDARDDDRREKFESALRRLADANCPIVVDTLDAVVNRGKALPAAPLYVPNPDENPVAWLFYTSGTTGTPKGAMLAERHIMGTWLHQSRFPMITLSFMPMSHLVGYGYMFLALANGGMSYCSPKSDLSTLFEDLSMARPTMASIVPRVCEMFYHHFLGEVDRRTAAGADPKTVEDDVKFDMRTRVLGGRLLSVGCGSAVLAPEIYAFMESMLGQHMPIGYSTTELATGTVLHDGKVQRPPVIDYKLVDVPELGYFNTDKPHPRGELLVKTRQLMLGYFKRPDLTAEKMDEDGYYKTGDVMAEIAPDRLVYVDRRNNVLKLSQGEFVAIARLEALYTQSPFLRQIYVYGSSDRSFLLAVAVPTDEMIARLGPDGAGADQVKSTIRRSLQQIAEEHHLHSYEIPREFLIETVPFSLENGLLSGIGKFLRPKFSARYGERLERLYAQLAQDQLAELRALRSGGADRPALETLIQAIQATLGVSTADVQPDARFGDLGGDSLSALTLSVLLEEIFGFEVPVGVIINPAGNLRHIAAYIDAERSSVAKRPSFARVHAMGGTTVYARDLTLDKFIGEQILAGAPMLPRSGESVQTVLLTGATGFLGRFQALAWLRRLAPSGGKLICIARGSGAAQSRRRIESVLNSDPQLSREFRALAADHLEVLAGDIGLPNLGLNEDTWTRLAETADLIVHPAAHVNHVLPYNQLFAANVRGTAELIRLALTTRLKRFHYISTLGVVAFTDDYIVGEDDDIRRTIPACEIDDSYANGYGISKWAGEVLLRGASDLCDLPISVFRPGMILAHSRYAGQLNVPDMFTRLLFSLIATGIAPSTFYAHDLSAGRPRGRYEGLTVDFLAEALTVIGDRDMRGFHSYNLGSTRDDGVSLDSFVDWLIDAGCKIERIDNYEQWLSRFETAMRALPEEQRKQSMLAILGPYRHPQTPGEKSIIQAERFTAATEAAGLHVPRLSAELISKYVADLRLLGNRKS
jgi:fatty acid CoA ligase FadD9